MRQPVFEMERWQSRFENTVRCNLSDSGVLPFRFAEFCEFANVDPGDVVLGYGLTEGTVDLRSKIAALYPGATGEDVVVTTGSAEANFLAVWRLVEPGDRVVVVQPTYGQTPGLAMGMGGRVEALWLEEGHDWQPAPGAASEVIRAGTRLVVVTNPNNPTGVVLSDRSRREIVEAAEAAGAWILADEVYAGAEVTGDVTCSLWGQTARVIVTASLSKAYGLPGLRLGWLVAPREVREDLWARKDYTSIAPAGLSDRLARAALESDIRTRILERCRRIVRANLDIVEAWAEGSSGIRYRSPDAGAICLFTYDAPIASLELAERLRVEHSVLIVPGAHFDLESTFRIGYGYEADKLPTGLGSVAQLLAACEQATA
ncbi:MAG: aminotransferase class I/II-fold pyridoxal phosphate-dependent enzyme [Gemmatimonadota bacterium]|nr:aminotransferase class I/II-fold pyridoxal phosphate-dependent enzyme [Gemmatimonadota bacterium]